VVVGGDSGELIVATHPDSVAGQAFTELARQVVRQLESGTAGHTHGQDHDHSDHEPAHTH